jgi:hypothetical protein
MDLHIARRTDILQKSTPEFRAQIIGGLGKQRNWQHGTDPQHQAQRPA